MNAETQASIAAWRIATFGRAKDPATTLARAGEEFLELMEMVTPDGVDRPIDVPLAAVAQLWQKRCRSPARGLEDIRDEMADVLIVLFGAAEEYGFDLLAEVDRKMAVNRARKWRTNGDGLGQHI